VGARNTAAEEATAAGLGAAAHEPGHYLPPPAADPVSQNKSATYTERSYQLPGAFDDTPITSSTTPIDPAERYGTDEALRQDPGTASQSHLGHDTALAGAGAAALGTGALGYEASRQHDQEPANYSRIRPDETPAGAAAQAAGSGLGYEASQNRDPEVDRATYTAREFHLPGDSSGFHRDDEKPNEGYVHHTSGPHATDMANRLDPHVPGEFPTETGEDPHEYHLGRDAAIGAGALGLGAAGYEASRDKAEPSAISKDELGGQGHPIQTTTNTLESAPTADVHGDTNEHHYARDAAIAGGVGVAGVGAYELAKDHEERFPNTSQPLRGQAQQQEDVPVAPQPTAPAQHHLGRDAAVAGGVGAAGVGAYGLEKNHKERMPAPRTMDEVQQPVDQAPEPEQHHYGRDAAVAGGVGAAGVGACELDKDHAQEMPPPQAQQQQPPPSATATRTAPQEPAKNQKTAGLHDSDLANKIDPRVESDPAKAAEKEHEHRHAKEDTTLAGGARAVAGVEEARREESRRDQAPSTPSPISTTQPPEDQQSSKGPTSTIDHKEDPHITGSNLTRYLKAEFGLGSLHKGGLHEPSNSVQQDQGHHSDASASTNLGPAAAGDLGSHGSRHHEHNKLHKKNDSRYPQQEKHEQDLQEAREREAEIGGDRGEKKGLMQKILHPGKSRASEERSMRSLDQ
jgi:hypothetical protein